MYIIANNNIDFNTAYSVVYTQWPFLDDKFLISIGFVDE